MGKFTLEPIDKDNVKKIDVKDDITVINIPALKLQKTAAENEIARMQDTLDKINEVLAEYEKMPKAVEADEPLTSNP